MASQPPLNALRAFEAVARTGAFTAAGAELGVTSAAVSQQVRNLESYWDKKLFIRHGNQLALSDAGLAAYPAIARAMNTLTDLSEAMSEVWRAPSLILSAPQSVAETWLPGKLAQMRLGGEGGEAVSPRIDIRVDDDPIEFAGGGAHMRIFYGHGLYREYRVETLFHDHLIAVASPDFVAEFTAAIDDIPDNRLIHTSWGPGFASSPNWRDHLPAGRPLNMAEGLHLSASSTALAFSRAGFGAALVPEAMAQDDIAQGRLLRLDVPKTLMPHPYLVAFPFALQNRRDVQQVLQALVGSDPD